MMNEQEFDARKAELLALHARLNADIDKNMQKQDPHFRVMLDKIDAASAALLADKQKALDDIAQFVFDRYGVSIPTADTDERVVN